MERILRAEDGWEEAIADALRRAPRPIPRDERLMPRAASPDGRTRLRSYDRDRLPPPRRASTLLAIYPDETGRLALPLTVRRADMRAHAGEVSLPGGAIDPGDASEEAAALREAWEEVGLDPDLVTIAGALDDVWIPGSNFELRPFVGTVRERPTLVPHDAEVAALIEMPLEALFDEAVIGDEEFEGRGVRIRAGAYRYGGVRVWGATAFTLGMLAHVLDLDPGAGR